MNKCNDFLEDLNKNNSDLTNPNLKNAELDLKNSKDLKKFYNYVANVPKFHKYRKNGNTFDDIYAIEDNISRATGILITGEETCPKYKSLQMGDRSYFPSGTCNEMSDYNCRGKTRNIIVDNLPANRKGNKGLIPSILGDITDDINPGILMMDMIGKGKNVNDRCTKKKIYVTQLNPNGSNIVKKMNLCVPTQEDFKNFLLKYPEPEQESSYFNSGFCVLSLSISICLLVVFYMRRV